MKYGLRFLSSSLNVCAFTPKFMLSEFGMAKLPAELRDFLLDEPSYYPYTVLFYYYMPIVFLVPIDPIASIYCFS
jgi:hypothetical protein